MRVVRCHFNIFCITISFNIVSAAINMNVIHNLCAVKKELRSSLYFILLSVHVKSSISAFLSSL
jgi:hypothetical protein